jgi:DNA-3-methyladenine glycosylase II
LTKLITKKQLSHLVVDLCGRDQHLRNVVDRLGPPPQWYRSPGFRTLLYLILEQQISLASARAAWGKLLSTIGQTPTPENFLQLSDAELTIVGLSRQKVRYGRALAESVVGSYLQFDKLQSFDDKKIFEKLTSIVGIGRWTAEIYMLEAMRRPDIWPVTDLALIIAVQEVFCLPERPNAEFLETLGEQWRPWRSVATRILWHHYLAGSKHGGGQKPK